MKYGFYYDSPIGKIGIMSEDENIIALCFSDEIFPYDVSVFESLEIKKAWSQLVEYFSGRRKVFDLKLKPKGTEFRQKVWNALLEIPYGEVYSYKDVAIKIDCPKGSRAVGLANNKNPIALIIPCHRVIGSSGKLVGYRGGLGIKEKLLKMEGYIS